MLLPSWIKFKEPQKVSEASLRAIRRSEQDRKLTEEADKRKFEAESNLIIQP